MGVKKSEGWWGVEKRRSQRRVAVQTALCASLAELADKPRAAGRPRRLRARVLFLLCFFGRPVFAFLLLAGAIDDDDSSPLVVALCCAGCDSFLRRHPSFASCPNGGESNVVPGPAFRRARVVPPSSS